MLYELGYIFPEEGKGWVGDHNVRLLEQLDAFGAAEVAASREPRAAVRVSLQEELYIFDSGSAVFVDIPHFLDLDGNSLGLLALAIALVVLSKRKLCAGDGGTVVAGADKFFEAELVKVGCKVLEEIALEGIVAVAVDNLATEGVGVAFEISLDLFLDVGVLCIELVLLGRPRGTQASVQRLAFQSGIGFLGLP